MLFFFSVHQVSLANAYKNSGPSRYFSSVTERLTATLGPFKAHLSVICFCKDKEINAGHHLGAGAPLCETHEASGR